MTAPTPANSPNLRLVSRKALSDPPFGEEIGTEFGFFDRWNYGFDINTKNLISYDDWEARDLSEMLKRSARSRQIETVLTQPIMAAEWKIDGLAGDKGEADSLTAMFSGDDLAAGACSTPLQQVIDQATSAISYKKAFFELVWGHGAGDTAGQVVYSKVAWRSQTTCRPMRDPANGAIVGFEQDPYYLGDDIRKGIFPYKILNKPGKAPRAFVYINGKRTDPINGTSELEVAYWAYKTKQRILLLWFQYLESLSLPRIAVIGQDETETKSAAKTLANTRGGGVAPIYTNSGPQGIVVQPLDVSGKGADQFLATIKWLDSEPANAVLAGFIDLASQASEGHGSLALSQDASDFYLQSEEGRLSELATGIRRDLFAPVTRYNFGPNAKVPKLVFEPLTAEDKDRAFQLLTSLSVSPTVAIPAEFIGALAARVASFIGLDEDKTAADFQRAADEAKARQAQQDKMQQEQFGVTMTAHRQNLAGLNGAAGAAEKAIKAAGAKPKPLA
jgi:hypothetical protein